MVSATAPRGINRRLQIEVTDSLRKRFEAGIKKTATCCLWTGAQRNGYGAIKHQGRVLSAHVVAWVLENGNVPDGKLITHSCDRRLCCRVHDDHVRLGTPVSNVREMYARLDVRKPRGEMAYNVALTEAEVRFILAANVLNGAGARRLSQSLGKNERTIDSVLSRHSWAHIELPTREQAERIIEKWIEKNTVGAK